MERYVCVHGHFYQPPRENPWLEAIELQDAAYPYHDWNERITAECYEPNTASRILDGHGWITHIADNYRKISFNFGPTLLAWMEYQAPRVYQAIIESDRQSAQLFSGHGSALAQPYNHMIMPLANGRDKYTQVLWGIRGFEHRFGRQPEGMWLPETAVDLETLDIMARLGIRFTILAARQAKRARPIGSDQWAEVGEQIDPSRAYQLTLPSGQKLSLFFYDEQIARAVAFEGLLSSGEQFAHRLAAGFSDDRDWPQIVHIATDGETYGHHHRHGDMALAYALQFIESNDLARLTNYGEFLEKHPPTHEVEIVENTSWSCAHGVERWRRDCGCTTGQHPGWNQAWRQPLREALDWLRDTLVPMYEDKGRELLKDPWEARDSYIDVVLDRTPESIKRFLDQHASRQLSDVERVAVLRLLELQRHAMLMFTSCGWFFEDLSRIETVQVIQYAGRAVQLARDALGNDVEAHFLELLEKAESNVTQAGNGRLIYEKRVRPAMVDLTNVAAHYAVSSLFEEYGKEPSIYCFRVDVRDYQLREAGRARLGLGRALFTSEITTDSAELSFGVLHLGDHNLNAGVRHHEGEGEYDAMIWEVTGAFESADVPEVVRVMDSQFGSSAYSARSLFRDEQRKVLDRILESTLAEVEASYRSVYEQHYSLMRFLADLGYPLPNALRSATRFVLNTDLRRAFEDEAPSAERVGALVETAQAWELELDTAGLSHSLERTIERVAEGLLAEPADVEALGRFEEVVDIARSLPFGIDQRRAQNAYYAVLRSSYPDLRSRAEGGDESARRWTEQFRRLGDKLQVRVE